MYNEKLEALIDAAVADGVLTDKEKQVLFKAAQSYGIDLDEFEVVLEGRLAQANNQRQLELEKARAASKPSSNKFGDLKNVLPAEH